MHDERPMTVAEAADYLQISPEMVRRMLRQGRLDGARLGGRKLGWRIRRDALDALVAGGGLRGPGRPPAPVAPPRHREPGPEPELRRERMLAQLVGQAERAAAAGDHDGVARIAAMLAELEVER
jgi:excisionase family DNA binding protein